MKTIVINLTIKIPVEILEREEAAQHQFNAEFGDLKASLKAAAPSGSEFLITKTLEG